MKHLIVRAEKKKGGFIMKRDLLILGFASARSILVHHLDKGMNDTNKLVASGHGKDKETGKEYFSFLTREGTLPRCEWRVYGDGTITVPRMG